jgi:hypothetical protein
MAIVVTSWLTDEGFLAQLCAGLGRNLILLMPVVVFVIGEWVLLLRRPSARQLPA